jgi:histone deacetylase complex regulatory component SIN3
LSTLQPLPPEEVARYLNHRLRAAGRQDGSPFTAGAVKMISELSEGIPRNINNIGFNALSMGCALRQKTVDIDVIQQVQADFDLSSLRSEPGVTSEQLARASAEAQSLLARTNPLPSSASSAMSSPASNSNGNSAPMRTRRGEPLNPEDALAYIQEFIRRLKKDQYAN